MATWWVGCRRRYSSGVISSNSLLVAAGLAHEVIQELRPLIPPVAEQLGVVGRHQDGRAVEDFRQAPELRHAGVEEMARVLVGGPQGGRAVIHLLVGRAAGDAIVLEAGEAALAGRGQVRLHVIQVEVEADVAVEVAVARVARVAGVPAPDLRGRNRGRGQRRRCRSA